MHHVAIGDASLALSEFAKEHKTLFEKFMEIVSDFIEKLRDGIRALYGNEYAKNPEAKAMMLYADELQEVFDRVLKKTLEISESTVNHDLQSNANKKTATDGGKVQFAKKKRTFSYDELVAKNKLIGITIRKNNQVPIKQSGGIDLAKIIKEVKSKCKILTTNSIDTYYTYVPDINSNVEISRDGIKHSFFRGIKPKNNTINPNYLLNARISLELPKILNNSIEVNRSNRDKSPTVSYSSILIGVARIENSQVPDGYDYYVVRSVVKHNNDRSSKLKEASVIGYLTASKAKKIDQHNALVIGNTTTATQSDLFKYSISDLLNDVKNIFDDTFSKDVYAHFNMKRRQTPHFSDHLQYSRSENSDPYEPFVPDGYYENRKVYGESIIDALERTVKTQEDQAIIDDYRAAEAEVSRKRGELYKVTREIKDMKVAARDQKAQKWAYKFYKELGVKSPFFRAWFGDWRAHSIDPAELVSFAAGFNEVIMEKAALDNLFKNAKNLTKGTVLQKIKAAIKGTAMQGAVEGLEELGTELLNGIADGIINGDLSQYNASIQRYMMLDGLSRAEAEKKASEDYLMQIVESVVGGFIGGSVGSGGVVEVGKSIKTGVQSIAQNKKTSYRLTEDDIQDYLKAGGRLNKSKKKTLDEGGKIILTSESEIVSYINEAISSPKKLNTVAYGKVNEELSRDVAEYSKGKIRIEGSYLELVPDDISHAYNGHLKAKKTGDIDLSPEDFEKIPEYVDNYDELVYAIKYKNGSTKICLSKEIENGRIIIIEVVSKSRGSLQFKNMIGVSHEKYIEDYENVYKKRNSTNTGGDQGHSNSPRDATVSTVSISETGDIVNTDLSEFQDETLRELAKKRAHFDADYSAESGRIDEAKTELGEIVRFEEITNEDGDSAYLPVIKVGEREVSISDIELSADSIYRYANEKNSVESANEMIGAYKKLGGGINADTFAKEWNYAYQMGRANRNGTHTEFLSHDFTIPREAAENARAFGEREIRRGLTEQKKDIKKAQRRKTGREGTLSTEDVQNKKLITEGIERISKILNLAGYNIRLFEDTSENADRGSYEWDTNTISLNVAIGSGRGAIDLLLSRTLSHEITHSIQRWNPDGYEELKSFVREKMGDSFEGMVARRMKGLGLERAEAIDEVIAYSCEMMLKNSKALTEFAKEHKRLFEKICDVVEDFIKKIRNALSELYGADTAFHEEARFMELYADELQEVFDRVLKKTLEISESTVNHDLQSNANKKTATESGKVQKSISRTQSMTWKDQIRGLFSKNGTIKRNDTLTLSKQTPVELIKLNTSNLPLAVPVKTVSKGISGKDDNHAITRANIEKLSDGLINAVAIINYKNKNSFMIITDILQDGKPIVITFAKNSTFDGDTVHQATSIHIRENLRAHLENLVDSDLIVKNKNKLNSLTGNSDILARLHNTVKLIDNSIPNSSEKSKGKKQKSVAENYDPYEPFVPDGYYENRKVYGETENIEIGYFKKNGKWKFADLATGEIMIGGGAKITDLRQYVRDNREGIIAEIASMREKKISESQSESFTAPEGKNSALCFFNC